MFRLSIRSKIILGFVVVLLTFGGATLYGAWAVHTLGQQLRLVALGYSALRLELQDQQTIQANLLRRLAEPGLLDPVVGPVLGPRYVAAVAADRKLRRLRLSVTQQRARELRPNLPPADAQFLDQIQGGLEELDRLYTASDGRAQAAGGAGELEGTREIEERAAQRLQQMSGSLTNKVVEVVSAGERYQARTAWMTVALALGAAACGAVVLLLVQATLRPLRRLIESARQVARGNYRERVAADSPDEVGALGREFNAMAAALAEREQRLRRSEQLAAVGKMAAQITHEVRNPLSSIGLNAEMLVDEFAESSGEARELARAIVREVDRLTDITEQYLRFARLPAPRFERADVNALLRSLLLFLDEELRARGVRLDAQLAAALPPARLDENQIRQVLLNLIRNAAEAMADCPPEARRLIVRTRREEGPGPGGAHARIDVIDRGPGVPAELQRQIFEPFFTTKKGGTGLGLALAQEVVTRHGGTLSIESPAADPDPGAGPPPGQPGACFTVNLPLAEP